MRQIAQNGMHHNKTTGVSSNNMSDDHYQPSVQNNSATTTMIPNSDNPNSTPSIGMLYEVDVSVLWSGPFVQVFYVMFSLIVEDDTIQYYKLLDMTITNYNNVVQYTGTHL